MKYYIKTRKQFDINIEVTKIKNSPGIPNTECVCNGYKIYKDIESAMDDVYNNIDNGSVSIHSFLNPIYSPLNLKKDIKENENANWWCNDFTYTYAYLVELEIPDEEIDLFEESMLTIANIIEERQSIIQSLTKYCFDNLLSNKIKVLNSNISFYYDTYIYENFNDCITNINKYFYATKDKKNLMWHKNTVNKYRDKLVDKYGESYKNKRIFKYRLVKRDEIKDLEIYKFLFKYGNDVFKPYISNIKDLAPKYDIETVGCGNINMYNIVLNTDYSNMLSKSVISNRYKECVFTSDYIICTRRKRKKITQSYKFSLKQCLKKKKAIEITNTFIGGETII